MTKKHNRFSAFSLIEVMLVIALTSIIMLVLYRTYSALSTGSQRLRIQNEQREAIIKTLNIMYHDFSSISSSNNIDLLYSSYTEHIKKEKKNTKKSTEKKQLHSATDESNKKNDNEKEEPWEKIKDHVEKSLPSGKETEKEYTITLPTDKLLLTQDHTGKSKIIYSYEKNKDKTYTLYRTEKTDSKDNKDKKYKILDHITKLSVEWYLPEITVEKSKEKKDEKNKNDESIISKTLLNWYTNPNFKTLKTYKPLEKKLGEAPIMPVSVYIQAEVKFNQDFAPETCEFLYTFPSYHFFLAKYIQLKELIEKDNSDDKKESNEKDPDKSGTVEPPPAKPQPPKEDPSQSEVTISASTGGA